MRSYLQLLGLCALSIGLTVALNAERECSCAYDKTWLDLVFVFDSSKQINMQDFAAVKNFAASFVRKIPVSQQIGAYSRVGIINVGSKAVIAGNLTQFNTPDEASDAIRGLKYINANEFNIREGLKAAVSMIGEEKDRKNVKKVVVLFSGKDEPCTYQDSPMQKIHAKMVKNVKADENPCRLAAHLRENGHTVMAVGLKYDGVDKYPEMKLASECFAFNFDKLFGENFLDAICRANCFCPKPYVQFNNNCKRFGECVYQQGTPLDYESAQLTCTDYKAKMTSVFSVEKELFVRKLAGSDLARPYWIGVQNVNANYVWSNGAKMMPGDYNNWGKQDLTAGNCVFDDGTWNSDACDDFIKTHYFSCQKDACDAMNYC